MLISPVTMRSGLVLGAVAGVLCMVSAEPAYAQLKLPTTWDYINGFGQAGLEAWDHLRGIRGLRMDHHRAMHRRSMAFPAPEAAFDEEPTHEVWYHNRGTWLPTHPEPHRMVPGNHPPDRIRAPGQIRPIDEILARLVVGAIVNPDENGVPLHYRLDGAEFRLPPGHYQDLGVSRQWVIEFDRGGQFGHAHYKVGSTVYFFVPTESGWDLERR